MAEAATASVLQQLEDLTECSIHRGTYENPRLLPCMHSFCLQCLVNYTKDKPLGTNITCPLCRREIPSPADGIEGFPRNLLMENIIEIKKPKGPLQKDTLCDICQEDDDLSSDVVPVASMFCAECRKNLCDRCTKEHRRHNKSHGVLKMGSEEINEQLARKLEVSFCKDHSGKGVEMFCFDCQAVICVMCFAEKHELHKCSEISKSANDFRKQMEREIETISVCLSEGQKFKEMIDKNKDDFLQQIQTVELKIFERSEELRSRFGDVHYIDRDSNLLLNELKILKSTHLKDMQVKDKEIQRHLTIIASLIAYGREIIKVGSASDICRSANQFHKEVKATIKEAPFCEMVCKRISFQSTKFQENLGKLEVNCEKLLVKDLSHPEKSLRKTLNENPGKKDRPRSLQSDVFAKHSQSAKGELSPEATMEESLLKPKRVRKLKSPTPGGDASVDADAQTDLAESRVDDGRVLDEETRKLSESGDICIEVDRDRHHYLTTHFKDELKRQLPPFHTFEAEGKYKVAFALNSKKNGGDAIRAKYKSFLDRFHFEIVRVPDGVDGSVLRRLEVTSYEDKDSSFVLGEDNKIYKLIGKKNKIDKMKKLIDEHVREQLKPSKDIEGTWKVQDSIMQGKKRASILSFSMEHGKLNRCESSQSSATKNCSLEVSLFDKTKAPATEAIVCAVDSKMQGFGDVKAAVEFERDRKYKDECRRIVNEHHSSIPFGEVVHTTMTSVFQLKTKIKYIVHVVLEDKCAPAASVVGMRDVIYRCLHHAEKTLQTKSITLPHLGGSDYCDIGSFVRGSVEALQLLSSTSHLQRVCFVVKDSKTLQELAEEFESHVDQQLNSQFTPSSESSYKDSATSL